MKVLLQDDATCVDLWKRRPANPQWFCVATRFGDTFRLPAITCHVIFERSSTMKNGVEQVIQEKLLVEFARYITLADSQLCGV